MRSYSVVIQGVASPAAQFDMFEINAAASKPVYITRLLITQRGEPTNEEEQIAVTINRGHTTSGSGGTAPTPQPLIDGDAASLFTAEVMNTTIASLGTALNLVETAWNTRAGMDLPFAPEERPSITGGGRLVVRVAAPADAITVHAAIFLLEG